MKRFWLTGLALLAMGMVSVASVSAQTVPPGTAQVKTSATIGGAGAGPTVQAFWALPDMSPTDTPMTYCSAPGNHVHDDVDNDNDVPFAPNLLDSPIARQIQFFAVLSGASGPGDIGTVYVDVFHPGDGKKYELAMTPVANADAQGFLGSPTSACFPLEAAVDTEQVDSTLASSIYTNVGVGKAWRVFQAVGTVSKDQPYSIGGSDYHYFILATAAGSSGTTQTAENDFEVLPISGFAIDFPMSGSPAAPIVNWGVIKPGIMALVQGDYVWANGVPSVMATGNVYLNLTAQWSTLVGATYEKVIDRYFDIALGTQTNPRLTTAQGTLEILPHQAPVVVDQILAGQQITLADYTLESDIPTQIDLSLTAYQAGYADGTPQATGLPADTYNGTMWLWGVPSSVQNPYATENLPWPPR